MRISRRISPNPTSLDLVQKVSREVFAPKGLDGAKISAVWDDLLPPKWAKIQLSVSTLITTHIGRGLSDCQAGNHSHYLQGVVRCHPDTGWKPMLCYTNTVAWWRWPRGTPLRKHFDKSPDTPETNVA